MPAPRARRSSFAITASIVLLLPRVGMHLLGITATGMVEWVMGRPSTSS